MSPSERLQRAYALIGHAEATLRIGNDSAASLRLLIRAAAVCHRLQAGTGPAVANLRQLADELAGGEG